MIGVIGFTILVGLIWVSAFAFGSLVIYWFVRQGFAEEGVVSEEQVEIEDPAYTRQSLLIWAGFFTVLIVLILLGS